MSANDKNIRKGMKQDIPGLKEVLDSSELFPSEMLDDMIADYLNNPDTEEIWLTTLEEGKILAFAYCGPEKMTNGTYNLYAIAVRKEVQGKGIGSEMMTFLEELLRSKSARILIVDTSSDPQYEQARNFYNKLDYKQEATLREFWSEGEDKIVYWKKL